MLQKIKWLGNKILAIYACLSGCCLIIVVFGTLVQVISRYVFSASVSWSEELARYAFIWMTMLGAPIAIRKGTDPAMGMVKNLLPEAGKKWHSVLMNIVICITVGVVIPFGFQMANAVGTRLTAAMHVPFRYIYWAIPVGLIGIFLQAAIRTLEIIFEYDQIKVEEAHK